MTDLFNFLHAAAQFPKVYWKSRGSQQAFAGYGMDKTSSLSFGGQAFSPRSCQGIWSSFPPSFFFSPAVLRNETWTPFLHPYSLPRMTARKDTPTFDEWEIMVDKAVERIDTGLFKKVVLARQTTLTFEDKVDPFQVMRTLTPLGDQTSLFLLQLDKETSFLGASPEKLFHRQQRKILSEAIAGTIARHEQWTAKESAEIDAVQVFLHEKLLHCCNELHWNHPEQKSFGTIKHLYQGIEGQLKDNVSDQTLLDQLHPTPALGGLPQQAAIDYLEDAEPFSRGWYGGPFGTSSPDETDLAVAIRSALIRGNEVHLFAGAGIVKGSHPAKEWEELDRKITHYLKVFS